MYKFFQRNNKKFLAVFAVFLMIVFILPTTFNQMQGEQNPVYAHIGETKLYANDLRAAKEDWELLRLLTIKDFPMRVPFILLLAPQDQLMMAIQTQRMPPTLEEISEHPELFLLLQKEAEQMGVQVSRDRLEETLRNQVDVPQGVNVDEAHLRRAVHGMLLVKAGYDRAASVVKISEPMRKQGIAEHFQTLKLDVVEVPSKDFEKDLPEPTSAQLQEQFKKFAERAPGMYDPETDPMGFGYLFPNRVKVQYISIPRDEVRKAVEKSKSDYDWKVQAFEYYSQNKILFPSTQPTTAPTTQDTLNLGATTPATKPVAAAATTRPTTRPFEEAREEIMTRLIRMESDKLAAAIRDKISAQLAADWVAYHGAAGSSSATQPTTAPSTSLGAPYNTFEYLEKLAAKIQKDHGVLPTVVNVAEPKSAKELGDLPGIGDSSVGMGPGGAFADYAIGAAEAFVAEALKSNPRVLSVFEPSIPLRDSLNDTYYIFRLSDAEKSHKPNDPTEVLAKLKEDFAIAAAYDKAKAAADEILKLAKESSLDSAAKSASRTVTSVGPWRGGATEIPGLTLSPAARPAFARETIKLLKDAAKSGDHHPIMLIELPQDRRVLVARLAETNAVWDPSTEHMVALQVGQQMSNDLQSLMQLGWYDHDSIVLRMNYREEHAPQRKAAEAPIPDEPAIPQPRL